ncbi:hypothetical protein [Solibacillus sp. FSL K6-1523]|uniref:hypothetical protein n=1 Tax=Solibacillus sp. FSL K6-1523 TaxID=2921471 RepID=UPI0030FAE4EF
MRRPIQLEDDYVFNIPDSKLFEEATSNFFHEFLKSYEQTVKEKFAELYEEFPEVFPFIEKARYSVVIFHDTYIKFNIYQEKTMLLSFIHAQYKTFGDYKKIKDLNEIERDQKMLNLIGRTDAPLVSFTIPYGF